MESTLINKARNVVVDITLRSSGKRFCGKIIDCDEWFAEVMIKINEETGEYAKDCKPYNGEMEGWREDRILVNIQDISIIG